MTKTPALYVKLTSEQRKRIEYQAARAETTVAAWVRSRLCPPTQKNERK